VLPAGHRLRRRRDFATAVRRGQRAGRAHLAVHLHVPTVPPQPSAPPRAGLVVNRAVGGAVTRNTVRRRLRHLLASRLDLLPPGSLLVIRALPPAAEASSAQLAADLDAALATLRRRLARPEQPAGVRS